MSLHMFSTEAQECVHTHIQASLRLLRSKTNNNNEKAQLAQQQLAHYEHIWNISYRGNNFRIFYFAQFAKLITVTSNTEMWFWHFPNSFSLKELLFAPKTFHLSAFVLLTSISFNANASSDRSFKPRKVIDYCLILGFIRATWYNNFMLLFLKLKSIPLQADYFINNMSELLGEWFLPLVTAHKLRLTCVMSLREEHNSLVILLLSKNVHVNSDRHLNMLSNLQ